MKKGLIILVLLLIAACSSQKVSVETLSGVFPGMSCADLENYLTGKGLSFKKESDIYKMFLKEKTWAEAKIKCDGSVTLIEVSSVTGASPKEAKAYIDAQQGLLDVFRGNQIAYEEGNKLINMNNGVKLHQYMDEKTGAITHFKISVETTGDSKLAWSKVAPLLPTIGAGK